jgi:hypothetical protein
MGFFTEFKRNRRRSKAWDEARAYDRSGNFAAAAEVYERLAADSLQFKELIYEGDCHDAVNYWLKAGKPEDALRNSRAALKVVSATDWIIECENTIDDVCKIVGELYGAGYAPAAEMFANEINAELSSRIDFCCSTRSLKPRETKIIV